MGPFKLLGKVNNTIGGIVDTIDTVTTGMNASATPLMNMMVRNAQHADDVSHLENQRELIDMASDLPALKDIDSAMVKLNKLLKAK